MSVRKINEAPHGAVSFACVYKGNAAFICSNPVGCWLWVYRKPGLFKRRAWMPVERYDSLADARHSLGV